MSVLTLMFFLAGLLLATAWDADGNPNTDNLPQMVLTIDASAVVDADVHVEENREEALRQRTRHFRWLRRQPIIGRDRHWRPLAVPRRGT
jgi:hypothetical protein